MATGTIAFIVTAIAFLSTDPSLEGRGNYAILYGLALLAGALGGLASRRSPAFAISYLFAYEVLQLLGTTVYSSPAFGAIVFAPIGLAGAWAVLSALGPRQKEP